MKKYFSIIRRMWGIYKPFHKYIYLQLGITFFLQILTVTGTSLLSKIIGVLPDKNIEVIVYLLVLWFAISVIQSLTNYFSSYNNTFNITTPSQQYIQEYSLSKILNLTIEQHILDHSAIKREIITRGEMSVANIRDSFFQEILPGISFLFIAISTLFYNNLYLGLFAVIVCLLLILWSKLFLHSYIPLYEVDRRNWIEQNKIRTEAFSHLPLVKYLSGEHMFVRKYIDDRQSKLDYFYKVTGMQIRHRAKKWGFTDLSEFFGACITVYLFINGHIALGSIYLIFTLNSRVFGRITQLQGTMRSVPMMMVDIEKYFAAIDLAPSFSEKGSSASLQNDIHIKNLSFSIDGNTIIDNATTTIPNSSKVAIVGTSGSGKTTLVKILLRAYNYEDGTITIGTNELRSIDAKVLRQKIGYVEQNVDLFDDTIKNNIVFGLEGEPLLYAINNLEKICTMSRISTFYHRLEEHGLDTIVGERGIKLSGGERQRVGIARALARNPEILIFDEATSALDTENESYIKEAIDAASKGRTTIIIAHRLSTVKDADKIIVMDKGSIVAEGAHDELMENSVHYQTLTKHQLSD